MYIEEVPVSNIYSLIAGRLIWDPLFADSLMENPEKALIETFERAGITPTEELLNPLVYQIEYYINKVGFDILKQHSTEYMLSGAKVEMV